MKTYSQAPRFYNNSQVTVLTEFSRSCRLCSGQENQNVDIFDKSCNFSIPSKIKICTGIEVSKGDGLPPTICNRCFDYINQFYSFREQCIASDSKWKECQKTLKTSSLKTRLIPLIDEKAFGTEEDNCIKPNSNINLVDDEVIDARRKSCLLESENICPDAPDDVTLRLYKYSVDSDYENPLPNNKPDLPNVNINLRDDNGTNLRRKSCLLEEENISPEAPLSLTSRIYKVPTEPQLDLVNLVGKDCIEANISLVDEDGTNEKQNSIPWEENVCPGETNEAAPGGYNFQIASNLEAPTSESNNKEMSKLNDLTGDGCAIKQPEEQNKSSPQPSSFPETENYKCRSCDLEFSKGDYLVLHDHLVHGYERFYCSHCWKFFVNKSGLERHMVKHIGKKPFKCSICKKRFVQNETRRRHIRIHQDKSFFACSKCPKILVTPEGMKSHMLTHHTYREPHEIKKYKCKLCVKAFCHPSGLSRHLLSHAGVYFSCEMCCKTFSDGSSLRRHTLTKHHNVVSSKNSCFQDKIKSESWDDSTNWKIVLR